MKIKLFIFIFLSLSCFIYAENEKDLDNTKFFYLNADNSLNLNFINGIYTPFLGIGCREFYGKNGIDWNVGLELYPFIRSKFKIISYSINVNYLRFLKSESKNKYYIGTGISFIGLNIPKFYFLLKSPTFIIGKQIHEKKQIYIIQLKINWPNHPNIWIKNRPYHIPKNEKNKRLWTANIFVTTGLAF